MYFLGLSYRNTSKAPAQFVKRSHVAVWKWIQRYKPKKIARKRKRISGLIIDETIVKIGSNYMWIWVAIDLKSREILAVNISKERIMLIAEGERFISRLGPNSWKVSSINRWWNLVSTSLRVLKCRSPYPLLSGEKSYRERTIQYIKDRTESFDDYFPCRLKNCKLKHIQHWLNLFAYQHNKEISR